MGAMDTYPPIFYMNDISKRIVHMITRLNAAAGRTLAAYTFDAGPNAVLYLPKDHLPAVLRAVLHYFPPTEEQAQQGYINKAATLAECSIDSVASPGQPEHAAAIDMDPAPRGSLGSIIHTSIG